METMQTKLFSEWLRENRGPVSRQVKQYITILPYSKHRPTFCSPSTAVMTSYEWKNLERDEKQ